MVKKAYCPKQGDLVRLSFDPQSGTEQSGWRPGLVISNEPFNQITGLAVVCPITSTDRGYRFHIPIPCGQRVSGAIMVEQAKSLDYQTRNLKTLGQVDIDTLEEVLAVHHAFFQQV